jgi:hypothetical protein
MSQRGFEINITKDLVDVRRNVSFLTQRYGAYIGIAYMALAVLMFYWIVLYSHGRVSLWEIVREGRTTDVDFGEAFFGLVVISGLSAITLFLGARTFFPSGDALHCDRSAFTVSRIPWFSLRGKWTTRSYPLSNISQLRFAKILRNRGGDDFWGLRFLAEGRKQRLFTGLEPPEAHRTVKGLHALGVDVLDDPDMRDRVEYTLRERSIKLDNR